MSYVPMFVDMSMCVLDGGNVGCYSYTGFKLFPSTDLYISIQTPSNTSPNTDSFIKCTHLTCHQTHTHNELCTNGMRTSPNSVYCWNIKHEPYYQVYRTHIRTYLLHHSTLMGIHCTSPHTIIHSWAPNTILQYSFVCSALWNAINATTTRGYTLFE